MNRKPGTCQPWVHPHALPPLHLPQGLSLPFLMVISDTAQLWHLGQRCRRKSLVGVSHLPLPETLTLDSCCSLSLWSDPDPDPLTWYSALTLDQAHHWGLNCDPWVEADPGPCHWSCHIRLTGNNRMAPHQVWHWPVSLTITHGPWLKALYKAASSSWSLVVQLTRASQSEIRKECSNCSRISLFPFILGACFDELVSGKNFLCIRLSFGQYIRDRMYIPI